MRLREFYAGGFILFFGLGVTSSWLGNIQIVYSLLGLSTLKHVKLYTTILIPVPLGSKKDPFCSYIRKPITQKVKKDP